VRQWEGRLLNIHPALLPAFKGLDTHARALASGASEHGATVHFVVPEMDSGPIIAQAAVPVRAGDTEAALAARVLEVEHHIYPQAVASGGGRACADRRRPLPDRWAACRYRPQLARPAEPWMAKCGTDAPAAVLCV
jgi:folate-dependent phosphoribosylglycinamide formyltransferase PurN